MYRSLALAAIFCGLVGAGCGDNKSGVPAGPFDDIDLTWDLHADGLDGPVHVVRDQFGIAHIRAQSMADLSFAQGYIMAHDRLPQMDILRRFGAGTLAELFGALDADVVESDLEMRMHRMKPTAEAALAELRASSDPDDVAIVSMLDRFAAGVNAYNNDLVAGKWQLDSAIAVSYDPARFAPWSPADSLVLGRFQAFALSWTAPIEVDMTDIYQQARDLFDGAAGPAADGHAPAYYARRGASGDLLQVKPIGNYATIDGFPNVDSDSGSRADGQGPTSASAARPRVPRALLSNARKLFKRRFRRGPHAFMVPKAGSNNWVVGPSLTGGQPILAGDQHLSLPNPSIFYPVHLTVPGEVDVQGITFPGIPGIILGSNGQVAWSATVVFHDVNDIYLEEIHPCATDSGDCVTFNGNEVPVETWQEEIAIGALGTITETRTVTYERIPHHGPIIPTVADRELVPRTGDQALSVRYTGHSVTHEIRTFYRLARARDVASAMNAFAQFQYGGQNFVMIDSSGNIGWTTNADVPLRSAASYSWDPSNAPDGLTPLLALPADGSAEWEGFMDSRYIPHAVNPEAGYLVTANSDPVGASFDGQPFNQPMVDGRPLWIGSTYAPGLRSQRIADLIDETAAAGTVTADDMARIQRDSTSTYGTRMQPHLTAVFRRSPQRDDVAAWKGTIDGALASLVDRAADRLIAWQLTTPPAVIGSPSDDEIRDSSATAIFNVWVHFFMARAVGDEYDALGWSVYDVNENLTSRVALSLLATPGDLQSGLAGETGQPVLCDDMRTGDQIESCDLVVWQALADAVGWLSSADAFDTDAIDAWRWGALHTLTIEPLFPEDQLNVPPPSDPDPSLRGGFPTAGDQFVVNRADGGWDDLDFSQDDGAAQRVIATPDDSGTIKVRMSLPGGTIYRRDSPHYRDLMDDYYIPNRQFDLPFTAPEIIAAGEERWVIRSR